MRAFTVQGASPARTLDEVLARMEALGAVADECEAVRRTIGVFLRWAERRQRTPDRTSGIAWVLAMPTMIYTHVMNRPGVVARSPLDGLAA